MLYLKQGITNTVYANLLDSRDNTITTGLGSELIQNPDFTELGNEQVTSFTNGTAFPFTTFTSSVNNITSAIVSSAFAGASSNGINIVNGITYKVTFTYIKNSGDDLRVLISSSNSGAGTSISNVEQVSASGNITLFFIATSTTTGYLQMGTGSSSGSLDISITNISVKKVGVNWNNPDGSVTFTPGEAKINVLYGNNRLTQNSITGDGLSYRVTYVISENIGTTQLSFYGGVGYLIKDGTVGTHTFDYTRLGTNDSVIFKGDNGTSITIDSISVKRFIDNPFSWLINITNDFTKESTTLLQIPDTSAIITPGTNTVSYPIKVITTGTANGLLQEVLLENTGYYSYEIYKQDSVTNLDITNAVVGKLVESGKALIYNADSEVTYKEHPDGNPNNFIYVP